MHAFIHPFIRSFIYSKRKKKSSSVRNWNFRSDAWPPQFCTYIAIIVLISVQNWNSRPATPPSPPSPPSRCALPPQDIASSPSYFPPPFRNTPPSPVLQPRPPTLKVYSGQRSAPGTPSTRFLISGTLSPRCPSAPAPGPFPARSMLPRILNIYFICCLRCSFSCTWVNILLGEIHLSSFGNAVKRQFGECGGAGRGSPTKTTMNEKIK